MDSCVFKKKYVNKWNVLEFTFRGIEKKENIDIEELSNLLDRCVRKIDNIRDVKKIILWIRTILKDFEENSLQLFVLGNRYETQIVYQNEKLVFFKRSEVLEDATLLDVVYKNINDFNISIANEHAEIVRLLMKEILSLEEYSIHDSLNADEIKICDSYKLFYNENPDFSKEDIDVKIQNMFYILNSFDVHNKYSFTLDDDSLISYNLEALIKNLIPFGEVVIENANLPENYQRKVKMIGELVREFTGNNSAKINEFGNLLYKKSRLERCVKYLSLKRLVEHTEVNEEEAKDTLALVKKINEKLEKIEVGEQL